MRILDAWIQYNGTSLNTVLIALMSVNYRYLQHEKCLQHNVQFMSSSVDFLLSFKWLAINIAFNVTASPVFHYSGFKAYK
jgi:hypothetical protein